VGTGVTNPGQSAAPAPLLRWAGSKFSVGPQIAPLLPADLRSRTWREPFLGAAGMYCYVVGAGLVDPARAELSDAEAPLVRFHRAVADTPDEVMRECDHLSGGERATRDLVRPVREYYEEVRRRFNERRGAESAAQAARLLYLNKTGFNGLYRTNRCGELNTPWGKRWGQTLYERESLLATSAALRRALSLTCGDFESVLLESALPGDVVYLDPPYVPASETADFTGYGGGWRDADHERLGRVYRELDRRGCLLVLSNSDTERVRRIYAGYDVSELVVRRSVSARGESRGVARELVVRNLASWPASARR
jgi:DNA adenine methylase